MRLPKTAFLLLLTSILAAQTAQFPTSVVTDTQLKVARNRAVTTLASGISAAATSLTVASGAVFTKPALVTIDDEIIAVCDIVGNTLSVGHSTCPNVDGRGFDSTSAAVHNSAALVYGYIAAWHHNAITAELKAIETALGAGFALPLTVPKGGMGTAGTYTVNGVLLGNGTGDVQATAAGTADQVFVIPGGGGTPQFGTAQVAGGGTGATTAAGARTNLGVSASGANSDITQLLGLGLTGTVVGSGGSGLSAVAAASQLQYWRRTPNVSGIVYGFANLPFNVQISTDYDFPVQAPAENLSPTLKTATLTPCPLGVNGADTGHQLGIFNNAGTWQETVTINGGTCTTGAASGTVTFATIVGTYAAGAYKIGSVTAGAMEANIAPGAVPRSIFVPPGNHEWYGETYIIPPSGYSTSGGVEVWGSRFATFINQNNETSDIFHVAGGDNVSIHDLMTGHTGTPTAGADVNIATVTYTSLKNLFLTLSYDNIKLNRATLCRMEAIDGIGYRHHSIDVTGTASHTAIEAKGIQVFGYGASPPAGSIGLYVSAQMQSSEFVDAVFANSDFSIYVTTPTGGYFQESHFVNCTFDTYTYYAVVLTGSGSGTGGTLTFSNVRSASSYAGSGIFSINSQYNNINITNLNGVADGYGVLLQGVSNVTLSSSYIGGWPASATATPVYIANDGATVSNAITIADSNRLGYSNDGTTSGYVAVTGLSVSAHAHTNLRIAGDIYGTSKSLSYLGTGLGNIVDGRRIVNGNKPTCAVGLKGSTWYTASAAGTADLNEDCEKDANDAYAWRGRRSYTLHVQHLTYDPADAGTVYWGELPKAPVAAAATSKVYIRKAGTIKVAEIYTYASTAGTNEAWSLYIRKNNSSDTLIATVSAATQERVFSNTALTIALAVGDYIEIKGVQPTWATNPLGVIGAGHLYIE